MFDFDYDTKPIMDMLVKVNAKSSVLTNFNDIRNSDLFAMMFKDVIRYAPKRSCWFYYDGIVWKKDEGNIATNSLCKRLAECLKQYCKEYAGLNDSDYVYKNALKWQRRAYRDTVIRDAQSVNTIDVDLFDSNPLIINFKNGTLDLKTFKLNPHNADDLLTKCVNTIYDPDAYNLRWNKFIDEIMCNDDDKAVYLQKVLGYAVSGLTNHECLFMLYGETTRNGKGTLMETVLNVLGSYGTTTKPETIAISNRNANAHSEDIARLQGVRLANISEPPKSMHLNSALVKTLTGGDTINARYLHENSFEFKPQFKLFINTNYLPEVDDSTVFLSNRINVITFDRHFSPSEQDKTLKSYFASEDVKPAIANWLIIGYSASIIDLDPPQSVVEATKTYCENSDEIFKFINEVLSYDGQSRTPVAMIYKAYSDWAKYGNHLFPLSDKLFYKKLRKYVQVKDCKVNGNTIKCAIGYTLDS